MGLSVVIGANYGDEGKGAVTDILASINSPNNLVIRYNGGAQAGHTVVLVDGTRHVFHHFGSGTLKGASTYLSRFFIVNPMVFAKEWAELAVIKKQISAPSSVVYADPRCIVTTPFDMMINQMIEEDRGNARHGSCGLGINETVVRSDNERYALRVSDITASTTLKTYTDNLRKKLTLIMTEYMSKRLKELCLSDLPSWSFKIDYDGMIDRFIEDCKFFHGSVGISQDLLGQTSKNIGLIFEGAQGLRLDMDSPDFPHVTRSKTGLANVMTLLSEAGIKDIPDVYYVTRPYLTRHGAGPLPNELKEKPYPGIEDKTNIPNPHQGTMRFAPLDLNRLRADIGTDIGSHAVRSRIVMTCVDQLRGGFVKTTHGELTLNQIRNFADRSGLGLLHFWNGAALNL